MWTQGVLENEKKASYIYIYMYVCMYLSTLFTANFIYIGAGKKSQGKTLKWHNF